MTTLLAIKSHPLSSENATSVLALEAFLSSYTKNHPEDTIEILDLYQEYNSESDKDNIIRWEKLAQGNDFTSLTETQQAKVIRFKELTEQFLNADKIVIANPLWNLSMQTRLKAWIDTIVVVGKTFSYTENGPVGLIEGKKALHIQSSGGIYGGNDFTSQTLKGILNFIGINQIEQLFIEGLDYTPDKRAELLEAKINEAILIGKTF